MRVPEKRVKKKRVRILKRMQRKLLISFLIICALFVGLIGRLMFIEYSSGERYEKIVLSTVRPFPFREEILWTARGLFWPPVWMSTM